MVFDRAKAFVKEKSPLSLQTMAVCFSESVGEYFVTDFAVASSAGKQEIKKPVGVAQKESRIQKVEVEIRKSLFRARVGRAKQRGVTVGLGNCVGCKFL